MSNKYRDQSLGHAARQSAPDTSASIVNHPESQETDAAPSVKILYKSLGLAMVGIGFVGMVLPLLPGIPFFVFALFFFERSSPRLRRWLLNHNRIGPALSAWHDRRSIPLKMKAMILLMMAGAAPVILSLPLTNIAKLLMALFIGLSATFILSRPST